MTRKIVDEFVIPKCSGKAFIVKRGQVLRVIAHKGKQVADIRFLNANNFKEQFAGVQSIALNMMEGLGDVRRVTKLYSKPPWESVMLMVIDDKVGHHFLSGQCSAKIWELWGQPGHLNCCDNFDECLKEYGLSMQDLDSAGVFNVFMPQPIYEEGRRRYGKPACETGDYIDFRAEMDILVAVSMCPCENEINDFEPKAMKFQIFQGEKGTGYDCP